MKWLLTLVALSIAVLISLLIALLETSARDLDGHYAQKDPELHKWVESLRSGKGPCCSDADGAVVVDGDWETRGGHYRVRLDGQWIDVPDEAVITQPNRLGRAMVWPMRGTLGDVSIRCFLPGAGT